MIFDRGLSFELLRDDFDAKLRAAAVRFIHDILQSSFIKTE